MMLSIGSRIFCRPVIVFFILVILVVLGLISFSDEEHLGYFFANYTYYILTAIFIFWLYAIISYLRSISFNIANFSKKYWTVMLAVPLITTILFVSIRPGIRMVSDEQDLIAVSQYMFYHKQAYGVDSGIFVNGEFYTKSTTVPVRPLMQAFCINVLHNIFGFHYWNAFVLNFLATMGILFLTYVVLNLYLGNLVAISGIILVAAVPLFGSYGTSAGYDIFATFFLLLSVIVGCHYHKNPSLSTFLLLISSLLMTANTRYEMIVPSILIILSLMVFKIIKFKDFFRGNRIYILLSLVALYPIFWQRIYYRWVFPHYTGDFRYSSISDIPHGFFSWYHFEEHLGIFFKVAFLDFDFRYPFAPIINWISLILLLVLISYYCLGKFFGKVVVSKIKGKVGDSELNISDTRKYFAIYSIAFFTHFAIFLAYWSGDASYETASRFFCSFTFYLATIPFFFLIELKKLYGIYYEEKMQVRGANYWVLLASLVMFLEYHAVAVRGDHIRRVYYYTNFNVVTSFLYRRYPQKDVLLISDVPVNYSIFTYSSVSFKYAAEHWPEILGWLKGGVYKDIVIVEVISVNDGKRLTRFSEDNQPIIDRYSAEKIEESFISDREVVRLSKLIIPEASIDHSFEHSPYKYR